jgi:hypothetical protein
MNHRSTPLHLRALVLFVLAVVVPSCGDGFGHPRNPPHLVVELDSTAKPGTIDAPLALSIDQAFTYKFVVRAVNAEGNEDTTFNRYVRISAKPGAVGPLTGPNTDGRNVLLTNGKSATVQVDITNAYGTTYIVADDLGYVPADPLRDPPPACANGKDDNNNGAVDFPADPGCAFANDDSEDGGTYTEGVSNPIFFKLPRIADIRGLKCDPRLGCSGNGTTPYPGEQILMDTGFRDDGTFAFDTVITRVSSNGYYATDLADKRGGFNSVFAFNFSAPPRMRVCDRLRTATGTAGEFFGFTQLSFPTWTLEEWDPSKRPCLVPDPVRLTPSNILDLPGLLQKSGSLLRVETAPDGSEKAQVTSKFGSGDIKKTAGGVYAASADASNCDFDKNGKINSFTPGDPEGDCSTACTADPDCTEWSNFVSRGTFRITVSDANGMKAAIQADATAAAGFDPVAMKGKPIRSFSGTMTFFSGGSQYTIEVRCKDDILVDLKEPPFLIDKPCVSDKDCLPAAGLPPDFKCIQLPGSPAGQNATKACRKPNETQPDFLEPPPLACVFPRTLLDLNPQ